MRTTALDKGLNFQPGISKTSMMIRDCVRNANSWPHHRPTKWNLQGGARAVVFNKLPRWVLWSGKLGAYCFSCTIYCRLWGCPFEKWGQRVQLPSAWLTGLPSTDPSDWMLQSCLTVFPQWFSEIHMYWQSLQEVNGDAECQSLKSPEMLNNKMQL